jgi:TolB-like protein
VLLFTLVVPARGQAAPSPADETTSILVLPIESAGEQLEGLRAQLADVVAGALVEQPAMSVVTSAEIADMVRAQRAQSVLACESDEACLSKIRDATDADLIVSGTLGRVEREIVLTLSLIDSKSARTLGRVAHAAATSTELLERAPEVARRLLGGPAAEPRSLLQLPEEVKFAVFRLDAAGIDSDVVRSLTQFMLVELSSIRGAEVISPDDIKAIVGAERYKAILGEDCSDDCLVRLSGSLNVDYLVTGLVGKLEDDYVVSLRLIDPRRAEVVNRISDAVRGPVDELKRAIRTFARRLIDLDGQGQGYVAFSGPVSGATVFMNGAKMGTLPLKPGDPLDSGRLDVRVTKGGYFDWESDVFVQPGETALVWADLERKPRPLYAKWWFWSLVGGVVAGGVATAVVVGQQEPDTGSGRVSIE